MVVDGCDSDGWHDIEWIKYYFSIWQKKKVLFSGWFLQIVGKNERYHREVAKEIAVRAVARMQTTFIWLVLEWAMMVDLLLEGLMININITFLKAYLAHEGFV